MSQRRILEKAKGKHIGHAVEGHCRGLLAQICARNGWTLERRLPFEFPVQTDLVVMDACSRIRALGIVLYTSASGPADRKLDHSTHKFYRTRIEYNEIARAWVNRPDAFSPDFTPFILIYGSSSSWKPQLLTELARDCPPTLFLPTLLGDREADHVAQRAFNLYQSSWSKGEKAARLAVEDYFAEKANLDKLDREVFRRLEGTATSPSVAASFASRRPLPLSAIQVHVRPSAFYSRMRQGLSLLSLFQNEEITAWSSAPIRARPAIALEGFIRRAVFLDLLTVERRKTLVGKVLVPCLRENLDGLGNREASRPDFADWSKYSIDVLIDLLDEHRKLPVSGKSFAAGGSDQAVGAWQAAALEFARDGVSVAATVRRGSIAGLRELLARDHLLAPEPGQPCAAGSFGFGLWWSVLVSGLATVTDSRATFRQFGLRRSLPISVGLINALAADMKPYKTEVADLVDELHSFATKLLSPDLEALVAIQRPTLLDLDCATSWLAAGYLAVTTNPSHNPLNVAVRRWLDERFPAIQAHHWLGYPTKRTVPVRELLGHGDCRVEWAFGTLAAEEAIFVESRSITANNLGNKSKEIYDRLSQTRSAAEKAGKEVRCIGIMDGDFGDDVLAELSSDIGFDEMYSISEVLESLNS